MFRSLLLQITAGILGLFLAQKYIPNVEFVGNFFVFPKDARTFSEFLKTLVFLGILLGFLNYFIKPLLKTIALPLRIITLNLFSIVIAMFLVWLVNIFSAELTIQGMEALFWTTLLVWVINFILSKLFPKPVKL